MTHTEMIIDADAHFAISSNTRAITQGNKTNVAQNDHNSERFSFVVPRYIDGHDMLACNSVQVHYQSEKGTQGVYTCDDLRIDPENEENVLFSWLLSRNATCDKGTLEFCIVFRCLLENGTVDYSWHTSICKLIYIIESMDCEPGTNTDYIDILEQIKQETIVVANEAQQIANRLREDADSGVFDGQQGPKGDKGEQGQQGPQGEQGIQGEPGLGGLIHKTTLDISSGNITVEPFNMTVIGELTGETSITLSEPIVGYDNEWSFQIIQGATAQQLTLPVIKWGLGIAPTFAANTITVCRLYYLGNTLQGEWACDEI